MKPGQVERHTHDYKRNGTLGLFAALEVRSGTVTHETRERHTGADFLAFLHRLARAHPRGEVHVVLDNVATHKIPDVQTWLAKHPGFTFQEQRTLKLLGVEFGQGYWLGRPEPADHWPADEPGTLAG